MPERKGSACGGSMVGRTCEWCGDTFDARGPVQCYCATCIPIVAEIQRRESTLRRVFGLTLDDYDRMVEGQGNVCAICGKRPPRRLAVDHDHKTMLIRGALCTYCNHHVLGAVRDNLAILKAAVAYLESPPALATLGERFAPPRKRKRKAKK